MLGCKLENFPFNYLGLPVGARVNSKAIWEPVINKVKNKLQSWKNKFLSGAGKLTLLKSVLANLPLYFMSLFKIPASVKAVLEKMQRDFLWGDTEEKKKMHTVAWGTITLHKHYGGLGVTDLRSMNLALLSKWVYRFGNETNNMWRSVLVEKYKWNHHSLMPMMPNNGAVSKLWRNISSFLIKDDPTSLRMKKNFAPLLGKGDRIRFWKDEWIEGMLLQQCYPKIYLMVNNKESSVIENGSWEGNSWTWNIPLPRQPFGREITQWNNLMRVMAQVQPIWNKADTLIWKPSSGGIYTVGSARKEIKGNQGVKDPIWAKVWAGLVPPKIEIFMWKLIHNSVPVKEMLLQRGMLDLEDAKCVLCNQETESCIHLFFKCRRSCQVWGHLNAKWQMNWVCPGNIKASFKSWMDNKIENQHNIAWRMTFFAACWSIWLGRNEVVFGEKTFDEHQTAELTMIRVFHWFKAKQSMSTATVGEAIMDPRRMITFPKIKFGKKIEWSKPPSGYMKFNVDASCMENRGQTGLGGILRDNVGRTRAVFSITIDRMLVEEAEYRAIVEAMRIFDRSGLANNNIKLMVETDSIVACNWSSRSNNTPWRLSLLGQEAQELKKKLQVQITKVPREINFIAHNLAKAAATRVQAMTIML